MTEPALWGNVYTVTDNSEAREDSAAGGEAYVRKQEPGVVARGRSFGLATQVESEPRMVWLLVVGSIIALFAIGKTFKTAKA